MFDSGSQAVQWRLFPFLVSLIVPAFPVLHVRPEAKNIIVSVQSFLACLFNRLLLMLFVLQADGCGQAREWVAP